MTHTDILVYMLQSETQARQTVNLEVERFLLSERDGLRVLEALANPPAPNARLLAAAHALPVAVPQFPFVHESSTLSNPSRRQIV